MTKNDKYFSCLFQLACAVVVDEERNRSYLWLFVALKVNSRQTNTDHERNRKTKVRV